MLIFFAHFKEVAEKNEMTKTGFFIWSLNTSVLRVALGLGRVL